MSRIGFMQGRMSPLVDGQIQAFPWDHWCSEFALAEQQGMRLMEWTLDHERLQENPLLTSKGQQEIKRLSSECSVSIPSVTGDCFMQVPFWKALKTDRDHLKGEFITVVKASSSVGIKIMVVPLVDNGRLETPEQEDELVQFLTSQISLFRQMGIIIVFETDFIPREVSRFIGRLPLEMFGVNYDIGNSAALGFDFQEEFGSYGDRILNVHVKDRILNGTTVPLGTGSAQLPETVSTLERQGYRGNYVLQTARAVDGDHVGAICRYRDMVKDWIGQTRWN